MFFLNTDVEPHLNSETYAECMLGPLSEMDNRLKPLAISGIAQTMELLRNENMSVLMETISSARRMKRIYEFALGDSNHDYSAIIGEHTQDISDDLNSYKGLVVDSQEVSRILRTYAQVEFYFYEFVTKKALLMGTGNIDYQEVYDKAQKALANVVWDKWIFHGDTPGHAASKLMALLFSYLKYANRGLNNTASLDDLEDWEEFSKQAKGSPQTANFRTLRNALSIWHDMASRYSYKQIMYGIGNLNPRLAFAVFDLFGYPNQYRTVVQKEEEYQISNDSVFLMNKTEGLIALIKYMCTNDIPQNIELQTSVGNLVRLVHPHHTIFYVNGTVVKWNSSRMEILLNEDWYTVFLHLNDFERMVYELALVRDNDNNLLSLSEIVRQTGNSKIQVTRALTSISNMIGQLKRGEHVERYVKDDGVVIHNSDFQHALIVARQKGADVSFDVLPTHLRQYFFAITTPSDEGRYVVPKVAQKSLGLRVEEPNGKILKLLRASQDKRNRP